MKKIDKELTEEDLLKLTLPQFHQIWFNEALTDRQVAKRYNTSVQVVKDFRKKFGLNWFNAAWLMLVGGEQYKDDRTVEKRKKKANDKLLKQINKESRFR